MKYLLIRIKKEVHSHYNTANALPLDKMEASEKVGLEVQMVQMDLLEFLDIYPRYEKIA